MFFFVWGLTIEIGILMIQESSWWFWCMMIVMGGGISQKVSFFLFVSLFYYYYCYFILFLFIYLLLTEGRVGLLECAHASARHVSECIMHTPSISISKRKSKIAGKSKSKTLLLTFAHHLIIAFANKHFEGPMTQVLLTQNQIPNKW